METRVPITGIHINACWALRHVIPVLKRDRQGSWEQAANKTSCVSALWVQLRDPGMVNKAESNREGSIISSAPSTCAHMLTHTHTPYIRKKIKKKGEHLKVSTTFSIFFIY